TFEGHRDEVGAIAFSPNGKMVVTASKTRTVLWDAAAGEHHETLETDVQPISVAFSPDSKRVALGGSDNRVQVFDVGTDKAALDLEGSTGPVRSVAFSPNGKMLATCGDDRNIRLWDAESGKLLRKAARLTGKLTALAFSADGKSIAAAGND